MAQFLPSCILLVVVISVIQAQQPPGGSGSQQTSGQQQPTYQQNPLPPYQAPPNPEEVKTHLGKLVEEQIDKDKNGQLEVEELKEWIKKVHEQVIKGNIDRQWAYFDPPKEAHQSWHEYQPEQKEALSWDTYLNLTYPEHVLQDMRKSSEDNETVDLMLSRLERRWKFADADNNGMLSKQEFGDFIHPEEAPRMGELLVQESIEDMDRDQNGEISLEEYMNHMKAMAGKEKDDPSWSQLQQNQFGNYLDKNKDGSLNREEMRDWIVPEYDRAEAEAWRLLSIADTDRDTKISKDDVLKNYEHFVLLIPPDFWIQHHQAAMGGKHDEF